RLGRVETAALAIVSCGLACLALAA
ncbi:MAG: hypothetical protein QOJ03_3251, partial [Frankiaceae bacterium]|nr:hypothetical protein [Frankiaceae bacterium]